MFRSFRPALETLEKREVFSAVPLDFVAALGDQPIAHDSRNQVAIETLEVSVAREQQRPDGMKVPSVAVDPRDPNVLYLGGSGRLANGRGLELGQRQITATYNGDTTRSAVFEHYNERTWLAAADRDSVLLEQSDNGGANGLLATTYGRGVVAGDFNNDGHIDLKIQSPRDAASGLPERQQAGVYVEEVSFTSQIQSSANYQGSFAAHHAVFDQIGLQANLQRPGNDPKQIIAILIG